MKKRLLVISQHYWPENFRINDICAGFVERGYAVDVLCGLPNYPKGRLFPGYSFFKRQSEIYKGAHIIRSWEIPRYGNRNESIFLNYISFPIFAVFRIMRLIIRRYDNIFIYQTSPVLMALPGILLGKLKRIPITMYVLDLWPENLYAVLPIQNKLLANIVRWVSNWHYRHSDKLICLSEGMRERLVSVIGELEIDVSVLPQLCEKLYEILIHDETLVSRFLPGFNVLITGNISPAQSLETVVAAAVELKREGLGAIRFIVVGDGMSRVEVEHAVGENNVHDMFVFEGIKPVTDIPKYGYVSHVLLGTLVKSDKLGLTIPAKVMSYIAMGKPIVLAMDDEPSLLINEIGCGFSGPAGDSHCLCENIKKIYNMHDSERMELCEKAKAYHRQNFDRDAGIDKLIHMIEMR